MIPISNGFVVIPTIITEQEFSENYEEGVEEVLPLGKNTK